MNMKSFINSYKSSLLDERTYEVYQADVRAFNERKLSEPQYCFRCMEQMYEYTYLKGHVTFFCPEKTHNLYNPDWKLSRVVVSSKERTDTK